MSLAEWRTEMKEWWLEAGDAARNTATLTEANQLVLAFQFERARITNPSGFTMDLYGDLISPKHGYAVALTPESFASVGDALSTLASMQEEWGFRNLHLGYWKDNGQEYIDVVMVTRSGEMARSLAFKMDQKAYYDFSAGKSVLVTAFEEMAA
jgi:hypothetical protein